MTDCKMRLALDFDGVLSDTNQSWVNHYNADNKDDLTKDFITHRDIDIWGFYTKLDMTLDKFSEYFDKSWKDWQNLQPQENHLAQKTKMLNNLIDVDIVTAVNPEHLDDIRQWLSHHNIKYNKIVHSNAKHDLNYDIYVDDSANNIEKVLDNNKIGLLYNQAWNRDIKNVDLEGGGKITRIYNLYHAIDIVRDLIE